jgi:hypothetical protein
MPWTLLPSQHGRLGPELAPHPRTARDRNDIHQRFVYGITAGRLDALGVLLRHFVIYGSQATFCGIEAKLALGGLFGH